MAQVREIHVTNTTPRVHWGGADAHIGTQREQWEGLEKLSPEEWVLQALGVRREQVIRPARHSCCIAAKWRPNDTNVVVVAAYVKSRGDLFHTDEMSECKAMRHISLAHPHSAPLMPNDVSQRRL